MKIVICGTHFTPAQAVIEELKKDPTNEIIYIGRQYTQEGDKTPSAESQILPRLGIKFAPITTGRWQRTFTIYTVPSLAKIPLGFLQAFGLIFQGKPDVILSFGGYVSVPVVISGWLLSVPIIIHEQTLVLGFANTISSWFADKMAVSFSGNNSFSGKKVVLTGNPIRKDIIQKQPEGSSEVKVMIQTANKEKFPLILITGGNQGSHTINQAVSKALNDLVKIAYIIHQTGDSKFQDFENLQSKQKMLKNPNRYLVKKWIQGEDFGFILRNTDLVVSRAGMNTLLELAYFGIPTLVVPIPYLYKDEQNINAKFFSKLGLVKILPQKDLSPKRLIVDIKFILNDLNHFKEKAKAAKSVVIPDAAKRLVLETILLAKRHE